MGGGLSGATLEAVAGYRSRVLGGIGPSGQISRPVFGFSSSPRPLSGIVSDVSGGVSSVSCAPSGDREDVGQRHIGDRSQSRTRLLQSPFSGGKGDRRLASCDQPLSPERVCSSNPVQDGDSCFGAALHPRGRFPSFLGLEGRVFSNTRSSVLVKAIVFHIRGDSLPVQGPVLRTVDCPQVFTRVFAAVSARAHSRGIRLLRYLDDWLVLASSETVARQHVRELLSLCHSLGIVINDEKSDLVPSQSATYLGMTIDTVAAKVFPTLARVEKFLSVAEQFLTVTTPLARLWQVLLGHLSSLEKLVPHGRLRMRSLQWHLKTHWSPESDPPDLPVPRSREVEEDLSCWTVRDRLLMGVPFGMPAPDLHLYSDASRSGWGAHLLDRSVSGVWSAQESSLHINLLEMKALFLALQSFQEMVTGHHVTAMCDTSTVVAYINRH